MGPIAKHPAPRSLAQSASGSPVAQHARPPSALAPAELPQLPNLNGARPRRRRRERTRQHGPELEQLWTSWRSRPNNALRNRLVEAYQNLVHDVVRRMASRLPRKIDRGDLETAANFGLMAAIASFDPARGVRFESYGELRIKGALLDELRKQDWLPRPWRHRLERHKREIERLRADKQAEPSDEDVAAALDMPPEEYRLVFGTALPGSPASTNGRNPSEASGPAALEIVADTHGEAPEDKLTRDELLRLVAQKLSEQEYRIVYLKYWEELAMREIGEIEHLSESRVCKIHARLIERLRERLGASSD